MKTKKKNRLRKERIYITVPNLFTVLNLLCGFLAVLQIIATNFVNASWLIWLAAVFDAIDGRIARASGKSSAFGLQMDSLSDIISFGLAPSILVYQVHLHTFHPPVGVILSFFPVLFAGFRLARFNVLTMQSGKGKYYLGLPAPTAALTIAGLIIFQAETQWPWLMRLLVMLVPLLSLMMASNIPFEGFPRFSFKEKGANRLRLVMFIVFVAAFCIWPHYVFFPFSILFILVGLVSALRKMLREGRSDLSILTQEDTNEQTN